MPTLGFIVNPIAGMGGRVGLKGTDGRKVLEKAKKLGAKPVAPVRAVDALKTLGVSKDALQLITYPYEMGEYEAVKCGYDPTIIGSIISGKTTAADTKRAVGNMIKRRVDLILFVGGDGTARDVCEVAGGNVPILGVPAGVKVFSAVFANTPEDAGKLAARFLKEGLPLQEAEIMDVDERAFRRDRLESELKSYAKVPYEPQLVQAGKVGTAPTGYERADQKAIARFVVESMVDGHLYLIGPGTTTRAVAEELGIRNSTLLGVDLIKNKKLLAKDVREEQILREVENQPATIIVSPIGKQGFILGRGNQQISPEVVRRIGKDNILVLATSNKLAATPTLKVDTGDPELDREFRGHIPVIVGYWLKRTVRVV